MATSSNGGNGMKSSEPLGKFGPDHIKFSKLIDEQTLAKRIKEMGAQITELAKKESIVVVGILKGSFMFYADLTREIKADIKSEFLGASSYGSQMHSSGEVKITLDLSTSIEGKTVLLVEDIIDSGLTMSYLYQVLKLRKPKKIMSACLLFKPKALKVDMKPDFVGFEIGNEFVIGYGLDYQEYYRNLPYVAVVQSLN
jgi:hypoxanthine phosphoribosyltransferase